MQGYGMLVWRRCDRVGLWSGLEPTVRVSKPSTGSIRFTPREPRKIVPLAADGVEIISARPSQVPSSGTLWEGRTGTCSFAVSLVGA